MNLIVGLIVSPMQEAASEAAEQRDQSFEAKGMERLTAIERKLDSRT